MPRACIEVPGKQKRWCVDWDAPRSQIDAMRADGIEVGIVSNVIPAWVVDIGMLRPWCFFQDLWNFKNPLGGNKR